MICIIGIIVAVKVHMAGENGKVLCSDRKDAALRRTTTDEEQITCKDCLFEIESKREDAQATEVAAQ